MGKKIKIVIAEEHKPQMENPSVSKEIHDIQHFFDNTTFDFKQGTINFVFLKGEYSQIKRTMFVMGVFVNNMDESIIGLGAKLKLKFKHLNAQIATTTVNFQPNFIGNLNTKEGLIIHLEIPVKGVHEDTLFKFSDIEGRLDDVEVLKKT